MQQGWVKLERSILETDLWNDVTTYRLYMYLLLKVTHQDHVAVSGIELKKGQWIRSYRKLAQDLAYKEGRGLKEYSLKTIKKCVDKLVKSGKVTIQETEVGTLFTLLESPLYQGLQGDEKETVNGTVPKEETNGKRTVNNNKKAEECKKAKNIKDSRPKRVYDTDSPYMKLAVYFLERIRLNNESFKQPNLQAWSDEIRKTIEIDKRTEEQVKYLMKWVQEDDFEQSNVLSPSKLRKRFDQLIMKVKKEKSFNKPRGQVVSMFAQSETSKKRQAEIEEKTDLEESRKEIDELLKELESF